MRARELNFNIDGLAHREGRYEARAEALGAKGERGGQLCELLINWDS